MSNIKLLDKFLNKKMSMKKLSDETFELILPILVDDLSQMDFRLTYDDDTLQKEWKNLLAYKVEKDTSAQKRKGMKLCEHFMPNFYTIELKGKTFEELWKDRDLLEKTIRMNRGVPKADGTRTWGHSTPLMSEYKKGCYTGSGLPIPTLFRPHHAKNIVSGFEGQRVLDPCMGWGGRMLGTVSAGKEYIGFEPNLETYLNLIKMVNFLGIQEHVRLINDVAENMDKYDFGKVDIVLTSPPYFDHEVYCDGEDQCENKFSTYDVWKTDWLADVIKKAIDKLNPDGVSCWNVHNVGKMKLIADVKDIHDNLGFNKVDEFNLGSSVRPSSNTTNATTNKNADVTICYKSKTANMIANKLKKSKRLRKK